MLSIIHAQVGKVAGAGSRGQHRAQGCKVLCGVGLFIVEEEKKLVLLRQSWATFAKPRQSKWAADSATVLMLEQERLGQAQTGLGIDGIVVKERIRVKLAIAIEVIDRAVEILATAWGREFDLRDTQSFIRPGVLSGQSELGHTCDAGGVHAKECVCAHQVVVDFNPVPGNIREGSSQAIDNGLSNIRIGIDTRHTASQVNRVAAIEGQVLYLSDINRRGELRVFRPN